MLVLIFEVKHSKYFLLPLEKTGEGRSVEKPQPQAHPLAFTGEAVALQDPWQRDLFSLTRIHRKSLKLGLLLYVLTIVCPFWETIFRPFFHYFCCYFGKLFFCFFYFFQHEPILQLLRRYKHRVWCEVVENQWTP